MTRGTFTGSRMTGTNGASRKRSAADMFMAARRGENTMANMSAEERYKQIFEDKIEELRRKAKAGATYSHALPGTGNAKRKLSATAEKTIDDIIHKRAKKYAKEKSRTVTINPKRFTGIQGGRIDKRGAIFGPDGRWVATVDKKTGKVRSRRGFVICKYNAKSTVCEFRIASFIQNEYRNRRGGLYATKGHSCIAYGIYGQAGAHDHQVQDEGVLGASGNDECLWGWRPEAPSGGVWGGGGSHGGGGGLWGGGGDSHGGGGVWGSGGGHGGGSVWG